MRGLVLAVVLAPVVIDERAEVVAPERGQLLRLELPARPAGPHIELLPPWEGPVPFMLIPTEWPPIELAPLEP